MALPKRGKSFIDLQDVEDTIPTPPKQQVTGLPGGGPDGNEGVVGGFGTAIPGRMDDAALARFLEAERSRGLVTAGGAFPGIPGPGGKPSVVTETGKKVTDVTGSGAKTGAAVTTTGTTATKPTSTFPSFNDWLASFGGQNKTSPATDAPGVKQEIANALTQLQEAMKQLETGFINEATLKQYREIVSKPPTMGVDKYSQLRMRVIPATETIPQGFDLKTGQVIPGTPGVGAHVEYYLVAEEDGTTEVTSNVSRQEATRLGQQFEFESERAAAFAPLLAQLEANNAQGALEVAKTVVVPYMQHVFNLQLQQEQERAALEGIYAQGKLTEAQQETQNQFTAKENEFSRQLQKDLQADTQRFQEGLEESRQLFEMRLRDLDRQVRQREIELQTGFRYDDVEGRVNARKELERLDREKFKLDQQRGTLEILALIGQFPQFRNLLNTPEMAKQFTAMGIDISTMFNKSGPVAGDLPSAQAFAQMTPTKQQEALNNLAAKYGVAPEMILAEIQRGQPGGGGRITR